MSLWNEVGDGVYQRRYGSIDVSVCVVRGDDGLLVVDTRSSHREADEIRDDLCEFGAASVRWIMNTHAHFDHCFGNYRFGTNSDIGAPIYGHELMPRHLDDYERELLVEWIEKGAGAEAEEWLVESVGTPESLAEIVITPPTELVAERALLDLGDRVVEMLYLGRGHTDKDLLLHVPDAETWLVGDLLEESGPPMYGSGCFPFDWPHRVVARPRDRRRNTRSRARRAGGTGVCRYPAARARKRRHPHPGAPRYRRPRCRGRRRGRRPLALSTRDARDGRGRGLPADRLMTHVASIDGSLGRCGHVGVAGQHNFHLTVALLTSPPCSSISSKVRDFALSNVPTKTRRPCS